MSNKIYSKQTSKSGLHWFFDTEDKHITMRLAGKPSLLLEEYRVKYGEEGNARYIELLEMFQSIGVKGKSPFVFYINDKKDK